MTPAAKTRWTIAAAIVLAITSAPANAKPIKHNDTPPTTYAHSDKAKQFADDIAQRNGWPPAWAEQQIAQATFIPQIVKLIAPAPAGTTKSWMAYRARFIEQQRIDAGLAFWTANADALARAEAQYGVPPSVIVGIVGVETFYGRITGHFRTLDALATLSFDFPTTRSDRTPFFLNELEQFLIMCRREQRDCASFLGSYAGAMGLPQFMPSSINALAVDFDGDGHVDLMNSGADVVGSVAHFLADKGWQHGMPTHFDVAAPVDTAQRARLLAPDILPTFSAAQFAEHGAALSEAGQRFDGPMALVELQNGDAAPDYIAGTANFYAVTRYNHSSYYALAVIELGEVIEAARLQIRAQ